MEQSRVERDSMGEVSVPDGAYYGASTQRAVENFPISGIRFPRRFIWALGLVKGSAARIAGPAGHLPVAKAEAIAAAADEVRTGATTTSSRWTSSRPGREHRPTPTPTR